MADEMVAIVVPEMGESITEATIANWFKNAGDAVAADEPVAELETDKVTVEIPAPAAGVLASTAKEKGATVTVKEVIGQIQVGAVAAAPAPSEATPTATAKTEAPAAPAAAPVAADTKKNETLPPAARKMVAENKLDASQIEGSGRRGQVTKGDVIEHMKDGGQAAAAASSRRPRGAEEVVPMTKLRQAIARNLLEAQQNAAILTTFNEVDMSQVMAVRSKYKDSFLDKHGVKLGFMGFFAKAVVQALKAFPAINAEISGTDMVFKHYYHIGIAVGGPKGLVVPVVRNVDQLGLADIEGEITRLAGKVKDGSISISDMQGGTFTITNGGIYGSMMSTPIINPPQSGILGMHNIVKRAVVVNDEIVIRPMMYIALSYDHRIVDGKEAVQFLVAVKEAIEDPTRLVLEI